MIGDPTANAIQDIAGHLHPFTNLATHPQVGPLVISHGDGGRCQTKCTGR